MNLYLVQHGEAVTAEVDPARPLSERGQREVGKVARFAARHCRLHLSHIHHSGKFRARQTAEILAASLSLPEPVVIDGLAPMDDPELWASRLAGLEEGIMLVGHLPHLARLTGLLLGTGPESTPVRFQMGGIVALVKDEGRWALQWMLVPELVEG